jgi:hypothetical protein
MATLAGQKVKDAYPSILKLESGTATSTTKVIEDGAGNDTALKLSTVKVEVNGQLAFTSTPSAGSTETSALFLDASNNIVRRTLGAGAFSAGDALTATAPLDITSDIISLDAPTTLSQITSGTAASADSFFIYDASATEHKYITLDDLKTYCVVEYVAYTCFRVSQAYGTPLLYCGTPLLEEQPLFMQMKNILHWERQRHSTLTFSASISGSNLVVSATNSVRRDNVS